MNIKNIIIIAVIFIALVIGWGHLEVQTKREAAWALLPKPSDVAPYPTLKAEYEVLFVDPTITRAKADAFREKLQAAIAQQEIDAADYAQLREWVETLDKADNALVLQMREATEPDGVVTRGEFEAVAARAREAIATIDREKARAELAEAVGIRAAKQIEPAPEVSPRGDSHPPTPPTGL